MGRKRTAGISLSLDADGRTYKKDLGWEENGKGGYKQPRFWLGVDQAEAAIRMLRLDQVWNAVCARWERRQPELRSTHRAVWDSTTKAIARAVARGEEVCRLEVPEFIADPYLDPTSAPPVRSRGAGPGELVRWLQRMQAEFPMIRLALADEEVQAKGERVWNVGGGMVLEVIRQASQPVSPPPTEAGQRLHAALDAFAEHVRATKQQGGEPTLHAGRVCGQLKTIKEHQPDMPLASFDLAAIERMVAHWQGLPHVKVGRTKRTKQASPETARNHIKRIREFVRWLHRAGGWTWRKPEDYEVLPARITADYGEEETTINSDQVDTYSIAELASLWEYASPHERLLMILALNCGFGNAEVATLKTGQVHLDITHPKFGMQGSFITRKRKKTGVYGEWLLWPVTVTAIRWYESIRPASEERYLIVSRKGQPLARATKGGNRNQAIPNAWGRVISRVRKDAPCFRKLSFNKLRKTAQDAIRAMPSPPGGGEIAAVFGSRGRPVQSDEHSERYSNRPFDKVFAAIQVWGEKLAPVFATVSDPFPAGAKKSNPTTSLGKIKQIHELRAQGVTLKGIAERTGVPYGTVRFHLDKSRKSAKGGE